MNKNNSFEIPYRLETLEAVEQARQANLLEIGSGYHVLCDAAKHYVIRKPPSLEKVRPSTAKDFYLLKEKRTTLNREHYKAAANLDPVSRFDRIESVLPWSQDLAQNETFLEVLKTFPPGVRRFCRQESNGNAAGMLDTVLAVKKFIQKELLNLVRTGRTSELCPDDLKRLITAETLFLPGNEDVLTALRTSEKSDRKGLLYQNALAELLFSRIPRMIRPLTAVEPQTVRRKLYEKLARLDLTARQKMYFYGCFRSVTGEADMVSVLGRIPALARQIRFADDTRKRLLDTAGSLRRSISESKHLYRNLFLSEDLSGMQVLYRPGPVMKPAGAYTKELLTRFPVRVAAFQLYPTKDFLDIWKGVISDDCTGLVGGRIHLLVPNFFNIRIFDLDSWVGNIYMLDFTRECGVLLVDRIQMPRGTVKMSFVNFFAHLQDALQTLFADVKYKTIVAPIRISNQESVQRNFNAIKKSLPKVRLKLKSPYAKYFESLQQQRQYYVLHKKDLSG